MSHEELEETMINASNTYSISLKGNPCNDCKRKGRAEMSAGIFLGAATGSYFGPFGTWAGATLGFWVAAENALACVKAHC